MKKPLPAWKHWWNRESVSVKYWWRRRMRAKAKHALRNGDYVGAVTVHKSTGGRLTW